MAEVKTVKRTLTNPNACLNHVMTVNGLVSVGPHQSVEVEVDEAVSKQLDAAVETGVYQEARAKPKADAAK